MTMLEADKISPTPELGVVVDTSYIRGLASLNERMLILLDIEKLMMSRDMGLVDDSVRIAA